MNQAYVSPDWTPQGSVIIQYYEPAHAFHLRFRIHGTIMWPRLLHTRFAKEDSKEIAPAAATPTAPAGGLLAGGFAEEKTSAPAAGESDEEESTSPLSLRKIGGAKRALASVRAPPKRPSSAVNAPPNPNAPATGEARAEASNVEARGETNGKAKSEARAESGTRARSEQAKAPAPGSAPSSQSGKAAQFLMY